MNLLINIENKPFKFNRRSFKIIFDNENIPWFKATDIIKILEYKNAKVTFDDVNK